MYSQDIQITPESQINSSRQMNSYQQFQLSNPSFKYPPKPIAQEPSIISEQDIQSKIQYYHYNKQVPNNTLIRNAYEDSSDIPKYIKQKNKSINFINTLKQYQQIYDKCENVYTILDQQQCKYQNIINIWNYFYFISIYILLIYIPIQNYYQQYDDSYIMIFISIKLIDIVLLIFQQVDTNNFNQKLQSNFNDYYQNHLIQDFIQIISLSMQFISSINLIYKFIILILIIFTLKNRYIILRSNLYIPYKSILLTIIDLITYNNCLACIYVSNLDYENNNYLNSITQIISIITLQSTYRPTNDTEIIIYALLQLFSLIPLVYILKVCSVAIDQITIDNSITVDNHDSIHFKILKSYFTQYSNNSLQQCIQYLQTIQTKPNQIILQRGFQTDPSIYFILQGKYSIITNQNQKLAKLTQQFGEISFFTDQPSQCIINSDTEGILLKLQLTHFIQCLDDLDRQTYFNMRNQILVQQKYPNNCTCCKSTSHHISQCPKLTYIPNRFEILTKYSKSTFQNRQQFFKRTRRNRDMHSLQFFKFAQLRFQEFLELFSENITQSLMSNNRLPYEDEIQSSSPHRYEGGDVPSDNQISFPSEQFYERSSNQIDYEEQLQIPRKQSDERPQKINTYNKIQQKSFQCLEQILEQDSFENILQSQQFKSKQYEPNRHRTSIGTDQYLSKKIKQQKQIKQVSIPKSNSFQQFSTIPIMQQSNVKQNFLFQQNLSLEYDCHLQFEIDKMQTFKLFQPHHNYDQTIHDYNNFKHS